MLLPLISPVGSNFLKDFPSQNAENMNLIDAYARASLTTHPLGGYTPTFTATTANPTIGTGGPAVLRAYYYEIFDQVYTWGEFRFGTAGAFAGTGTWAMSLPFPALSNMGFGVHVGLQPVAGVGSIWCQATPANRQSLTVHLANSNELRFSVRLNSGAAQREVQHNAPIAWAPQDGMDWFAHYQRVAS
jgi:hypothetical protein